MDQSTIEQKIAILSHRINTLSTRFEKNLKSICANNCSVTTGHSQLCKSMSAQHASAYTSSRDYRGRAAAPTMMLRTNAQLHQSETFILRSQLHCTFSLPAVPNRTVYMGYHCEGYMVNTFEVVYTRPSIYVAKAEAMESLQSVSEFTQSVSLQSADICTVTVDISNRIDNVIPCVTNVICKFAPTDTCSPANLKNACSLYLQTASFSTTVEPYSISTQTSPPLSTQLGVVTPVQYNIAIRWTFTTCYWYMDVLQKLPVVFPPNFSFSLANTRCKVPQDYVAFSCQWKVFDPGIIIRF